MDVDAIHQLRGALLAAVGVGVLTLGGWWWQVQAPQARSDTGVVPGGSSSATYWRENPVTGAVVPEPTSSVLVDPRTGAVVGTDGPPVDGTVTSSAVADGWRGATEAVWTESARLSPGGAVVRQTRLERGERHLLWLRCTGPGELLVAVSGARSAAPMTVGCDGGQVLMELTGTGAAARLSFSPAGSQPVQIEARLVVLT
ncbi:MULTISPECIES: hypothetical protein [unclassified Micromonospora]|uniref:hypothetical protein n=1 Tax=unclassified Micromonospora TaxID=2617518 RepID=UPI0022B706B4|nr:MULTISPECIES: hypothetical protein [unclassified Micromonospora]MCZ7419410.1 hypothetical protein [Verrucosispora sp. WMMA2121]WBB93053.1 hypothetical protein O7597_08780 [Verrucosispora sp. WMMC514]